MMPSRRLAQQLGELLQQEHTGGQQLHPARVELEALRHVVDLVAGEDPHGPLERLVLEHRSHEGAERCGAAADGHRLVGVLEVDPREEVRDVVAKPADLGRGGGVGIEVILGQGSGADLERLHLGDAVGHAPVDDLAGAAPDVDDGDPPADRMAQRLGRADECEATLLLLVENVHLHIGDLLDLLHDLVAVLRLADRGCRHRLHDLGAHLLSEPHLRADDVGDLRDLLRRDLAVLRGALADAGVGALLHHLSQLPLPGLGDEQARRVGADVDRPTEHRS
jgi:hypothetical protein